MEAIEAATGRRPLGWLGPALSETFNTPALLAELGLTYACDWCNDDRPYAMTVPEGRVISVPYSVEINDVTLRWPAGGRDVSTPKRSSISSTNYAPAVARVS